MAGLREQRGRDGLVVLADGSSNSKYMCLHMVIAGFLSPFVAPEEHA